MSFLNSIPCLTWLTESKASHLLYCCQFCIYLLLWEMIVAIIFNSLLQLWYVMPYFPAPDLVSWEMLYSSCDDVMHIKWSVRRVDLSRLSKKASYTLQTSSMKTAHLQLSLYTTHHHVYIPWRHYSLHDHALNLSFLEPSHLEKKSSWEELIEQDNYYVFSLFHRICYLYSFLHEFPLNPFALSLFSLVFLCPV